MSSDNPELGETWELFDPLQGKSSQAVVIELTEGFPSTAPIIRVMNRLGRRTTVARSLFRLNWRFVHEAPNQACWYANRPERCQDKAFFRILADHDGWTWICTRHIPAGRTVQFPFDRLDERALGTSEIGCPSCHTPTRSVGSGTILYTATDVRVNFCGRCGSNWVRLDLEDSDGVRLVEQVAHAGEALHGRARNIQAFVGFEAWTVVRRVIQPQVEIQGIPVRQNQIVGPRTVIVTGESVHARVPETTSHASREVPILPAIHSFWVQIRGGRIVEIQKVTVDQTTGGVVTFQVPGQDQPSTLPLRDFFRQFRVNTPKEDEVQTLPHEPLPQERPLAGDTWWSWDTKKPVMVLRVDADGEVVRFKGAGLPDMTIPIEGFIAAYQLEPPVPDCLPGEEWIDNNQSKIVRIREVDMVRRRIGVTNKSGTIEFIPLGTFAASFVRLERVSVYARILDAEDDD